MRKKTREEFIADAVRVHGDRYDYSLVDYQGAHVKVDIICNKHKDIWQQIPANHINQQRGCPKCANDKTTSHTRVDLNYHLPEISKIHKDKFDFNDFIYYNSKTKSTINCSCGNSFQASVEKLKSGRGCPYCAKSGYKPDAPCLFYILKLNDLVIKCGITTNLTERVSRLNRSSVYGAEPLYIFHFKTSILAKELEDKVKANFQSGVFTRTEMVDGFTETFNSKDIGEILKLCLKFNDENDGVMSTVY